MVTSTRPSASWITSSRPSRTPSSEPDEASWKTLVESQTRASTPSSPIARSSASVRRVAELGRVVELPVAGVEDAAVGRVDQQRIALGDRMGERDVAEAERPEAEIALHLDDVELDLVGQPLLLELAGDQAGGERRRVERHAEIVGEIGDGADMVLMAVGEDDAEQVVAPLLDEGEVGQDQLDARIGRVGEGHAEIDHDPFALAAVEIDVHADLARAAEREEEQFLAGFHSPPSPRRRPGSRDKGRTLAEIPAFAG